MATIAVTKTYTSGSAKANVVFTYTYSVTQSDDKTTVTVSNLVTSLTQSGSGDYLKDAKQQRTDALAQGLAANIKFNNATIWSGTIKASGTTNINKSQAVTKTHAAQTKAVAITCASVTNSVNVTVTARTSYAVSYNANNGTGAPGNQTKWYGESLTLSSTIPTREGYTFKCWNTNAAGTGTNYNAGASYTANAAATLYAVWEPRNVVNVYDASGAVHKGIVTVYNASGAARECIVNAYDANGNKRQTN